jgi:hypothetical protein
MKKWIVPHSWLLLIILVALVVRLYKISEPLADWHSFRQADTASVTREYIKHGIDFFHPKYHDLSNIQSGKDNLDGYRMVEFPFVNALVALIVKSIPILPLVLTSRVVSILFSLGTLVCLFYLAKSLSGIKVAYLAALIFAFLPYNIFYSRAILPESPMLFFNTLSILTFLYWLKNKNWWHYLISTVALSLAVLLKPFVLFLGFVYAALFLLYGNKNWLQRLSALPFLLIVLLPFYWWRKWIEQFPSGIPANDWLFNGSCPKQLYSSTNGCYRFQPAWFRWLFWERITKLITGFGSILFPLLLLKRGKDTLIYISYWLGILLYFSVIATGNVRHDYYQVMIIPIVCLTMAKGLVWLDEKITAVFNQKISLMTLTILTSIFMFLSWLQVSGYFNINHWEYVKTGQRADQVLPPEAKVIAPAMGDTVFLFQTNRTGWPIGFDIENKIAHGAQYYVNTSFDDETNELMKKYTVVEKTPDYVIIDLTKARP